MKRPRPVLIFAALMAGLDALAAGGHALGILPGPALAWVVLISAVVSAVGGVLVQGAVTPLSAPQNVNGTPLVPVSELTGVVKAAARAGAHGGAREAVSGDTLEA